MVDYSSWKTIELSSDEDDVHPFIENGTLFRLRHEARLKKMEDRKKEEFAYECHKASYTERLQKLTNVLKEREKSAVDTSDLEQQMKELQLEEEQLKGKESKLKKQVVAWYIDTICHPGFSKMFINNSSAEEDVTMPEKLRNFVEQNKSLLKHFSLIDNFADTETFLRLNPQIMKKQTLYFMISYGIKMYLKGEKGKFRNIARQIICLQHVLELFKMYNRHSEDILLSFFHSIKLADESCKADFEREISKLQKLIKNLVENKVLEITGPEVCDYVVEDSEKFDLEAEEVFRSLPEDMQYCFIMQDKGALANILANMPADVAKNHMQRCIKSGLWIPENTD